MLDKMVVAALIKCKYKIQIKTHTCTRDFDGLIHMTIIRHSKEIWINVY